MALSSLAESVEQTNAHANHSMTVYIADFTSARCRRGHILCFGRLTFECLAIERFVSDGFDPDSADPAEVTQIRVILDGQIDHVETDIDGVQTGEVLGVDIEDGGTSGSRVLGAVIRVWEQPIVIAFRLRRAAGSGEKVGGGGGAKGTFYHCFSFHFPVAWKRYNHYTVNSPPM